MVRVMSAPHILSPKFWQKNADINKYIHFCPAVKSTLAIFCVLVLSVRRATLICDNPCSAIEPITPPAKAFSYLPCLSIRNDKYFTWEIRGQTFSKSSPLCFGSFAALGPLAVSSFLHQPPVCTEILFRDNRVFAISHLHSVSVLVEGKRKPSWIFSVAAPLRWRRWRSTEIFSSAN